MTAGEATGDAEQLAVDKTRLSRLNQEYARFSTAAGLRTERERTWVHTAGRGGNREESLAAVFQTNEKYFRDDGTFDLEAAKADYKTFLQSVPEKNRMYLQQSMEGVLHEERRLKRSPFGYSAKEDAILYDPQNLEFKDLPFNVVYTHELGHRIDHMFVRSWKYDEFFEAIKSGEETILAHAQEFVSYCEKHDEDGFLSDILSAICADKVRFPFWHEKEYWAESGNRQRDTFANLFALESFQDVEKLEFLNKNFTALLEAYEKLLFEL